MVLEYVGITKGGERIKGEFLGTKQQLVEALRRDGIFLISVKEAIKKRRKGRYTLDDFSSDSEQLSYLIAAGLQLDKAIKVLIKNSKKEVSVELWNQVLFNLKEGKQLSVALKEAFASKKLSISDFYLNIISVGEEAGNLKRALSDVSKHLQFRLRIKRDAISALSYPIFLIFVSIAAVFFISYFILPKFASIFTPKEFKTLPVLSKLFIGFGQFVHDNTSMVISAFLLILSLLIFIFSSERPRRMVFDFLQRLPFIRGIAIEFHVANLCSSLGAMLEGGVDIGRAMELAARSVTNKSLRNIVSETAESIRKGIKISDVWSKYSIIPDDVVPLVALGEHSAMLGEVFLKLGERHLENFKIKISRAMVFLEPAMIVFLGIFIGLIVISIMLAVLSLTNVS